jgi:hypothetical protein
MYTPENVAQLADHCASDPAAKDQATEFLTAHEQ